MKYITSPENKVYKDTKKLLMRSHRIKQRLFIAEGERIVSDALASGTAEYVIINENYGNFESNQPVYKFTNRLFENICDTKTTQGIMAVCRITQHSFENIKEGMLVICDGISDPGNLGTIIRTAECAGARGAVLLNGCADPYNPKSVRSTMGSIFRLPLYTCSTEELARLKHHEIVAAMLTDSNDLYDTDFHGNTAILVGNEAHGVSENAAAYAKKRVRIPMCGNAESLNAAVAAGIIMYEVHRQKRRSL